MIKDIIFGTVGGLGLFLYGIHIMSDALQKAAGDKMRKILGMITNKAFFGLLAGAGITSIIQSSSATTVMVIGFVNAGLMTLKQAIGVIFGANIGTTITAQLIAFKITHYVLPLIGIGFALHFFCKKRTPKQIGMVIFGFGLLLLGLSIMTDTVRFLRSSQAAKDIFVNFSRTPILGVLAGMIVTMIVQSSSATVGITMALGIGGLIDISAAIPLLLGDNIGTCITAMLASIGTNVGARRAAVAHLLFNLIGTIIVLSLLPVYKVLVLHTSDNIGRQIANAHTLFNVINAVLFLPFTGLYTKLIEKIVPGKDASLDYAPKFLEPHLLNTPSIAIEQARKELVRMTDMVKTMVDKVMDGFFKKDIDIMHNAISKEEAVDNLQSSITHYLVELSEKSLSFEMAEKIPALLHSVNDIERVGDISENLVELGERAIEKKLPFSDKAIKELREMYSEVTAMLEDAIKALELNDVTIARKVWDREKRINELTETFGNNHTSRLRNKACNIVSGIVFLDLLSNFEKMGDHLNNVADAVIGGLQWDSHKSNDK
ncbi:MAG: Na/Pi cotransporter family protein [bacterium]|nr:Na/Pi cotransporter family protein [bacterium]